jgi:rhodanese-related sulfurtransferase
LTLPRGPADNTAMAVTRISKEDLKAKLDGDEAARPLVVDARLKYPWEHSTLTLPGAIRLGPADAVPATLPTGRDVVVYDSDPEEITAGRTASKLATAGYAVRVLKGGLPEWVAGNLPVDTKEAVRAPAPATKDAKE